MKVELNFNVSEDKKPRILSWLRLFAAQVLSGEDETIVDAKIDGEDFPDLYKSVDNY